jgi:hypothetical protein
MDAHGDYDPWNAAAMLYRMAETTESLARIRRTVAASLREVGRLRHHEWPRRRAGELERDAQRARLYARTLRTCAERLTGCPPWRG